MKRDITVLFMLVIAIASVLGGLAYCNQERIQALTQRVEALEAAQEIPVELSEDPGELPTYPIRGKVR